jgi:hypothetical protein
MPTNRSKTPQLKQKNSLRLEPPNEEKKTKEERKAENERREKGRKKKREKNGVSDHHLRRQQ